MENIENINQRPILITLACIFDIVSTIVGIGVAIFFLGAAGGSVPTWGILLFISLVIIHFVTIYLIWKMKKIGFLLFILFEIIPLIFIYALPETLGKTSNFLSPGGIFIFISAIIHYKQMN